MELANIFAWDIDFVFDIRKEDSFSLLFEEHFLDGEKLAVGNIIAATFTNRGKTFQAVRYTNDQGVTNYYTPEGLSMRKAFLRTPLDIFRISSGFNLKRKHPIHKKIKAHRGVDYAAPRGTPVYSAGDGKVIAAGYSKANGNYVFVQHGQTYITKYLHLNKKKVRKGQSVRQRQLIGTVGSTGYATGPHLHYEFLVNGVHRNPRTVKLPQANPIPKAELAAFQTATQPMLRQLAQSGGTANFSASNTAADLKNGATSAN
jgi:murein DD-endopeptidase MepM/ murein hydrolase activator NlpD